MQVGFLGTGSSYSGGSRLYTSLVVKTSRFIFMIDCSGTPEYSLARQNININEINDIFFTHPHIDHIYALPAFIQSKRLQTSTKKPAKLRIYGEKTTLIFISKILDPFQFNNTNNTINIELINLSPPAAVPFTDGSIMPFFVDHDNHPSLGFVIKHKNTEIVFSGDTRPCTSLTKRINQNTNLIHECCGFEKNDNHTNVDQLVKLVEIHTPKSIYLSHLPFLTKKEKSMIIKKFSNVISSPVHITNDFDQIIF